jgi:hypothetical protein
MPKPRPAPTPPTTPSGSLRVWWQPTDMVRKFTVPVATIPQARTVLRTLAGYDEFRREGTGSGGLEVLDGAAWREWHNADGNDIRWVMADAEAA